MQNNQESSQGQGIDPWHYINIVYGRKWSILVLGILFAVWATLGTLSQRPVYTATLTMLLEQEEAPLVSVQDLYRTSRMGYEYTETEYGILKSRSLAEKVVRRAQLHKHKYFQAEPEESAGFDLSFFIPSSSSKSDKVEKKPVNEEAKIKGLIGFVSGGVRVFSDESRIIELSFVSGDPDLSVLIVNTLAEVYIDDHLQAELESTQRATEWLTERLQDLKVNLNSSEARLQAFRDKEQLIDIQGGVATIGARELDDLSARLSEARAKRAQVEGIYKEASRSDSVNVEELMSIPAVLNYGSLREYKSTQANLSRRVAELAKRYGPKHPKMIALQSELVAANLTLQQEVKKVVGAIERDYEAALRTEKTLSAQLERSKGSLQNINRKEFKLLELQREVETNRQLYDMFFQRIRETTDATGFMKAHARVLDAAEYASASQASKIRSIVIAFILGIMLATAAAIGIDYLDDTIKTPSDAQDKLNVPFLGIIPIVKDTKGKKVDAEDFPSYWENTQSSFAESIRTIRTGIVLESLDAPAKVIVVTSTMPGEGKSTLAINLGSALGQMENVLVIGADLRRPTIAQKCNFAPNQPGLSNYLAGTSALQDCLVQMEQASMYVMPAGIIPPNPLEMLSTDRFKEALDYFKTKFDRIIIDTAPTHAVSDALVLASYAEAVIYVVKADDTSEKLVKQGLNRVLASKSLTGVVLNDFDESKTSKYASSGYYYNDYYSGYKA